METFQSFVISNTDVVFGDLCEQSGHNQLSDEVKNKVKEAFTNNTGRLENPPYGAGEYMGAAYMGTKRMERNT